jgi:hypothetical protein
MRVRLLDGAAGRGPDVREEQRRGDAARDLAQVPVVPRRLDAVEDVGAPSPSSMYQPTPNPSPLVVVAPSCECRLWSTSDRSGLTRNSSRRIGDPE